MNVLGIDEVEILWYIFIICLKTIFNVFFGHWQSKVLPCCYCFSLFLKQKNKI